MPSTQCRFCIARHSCYQPRILYCSFNYSTILLFIYKENRFEFDFLSLAAVELQCLKMCSFLSFSFFSLRFTTSLHTTCTKNHARTPDSRTTCTQLFTQNGIRQTYLSMYNAMAFFRLFSIEHLQYQNDKPLTRSTNNTEKIRLFFSFFFKVKDRKRISECVEYKTRRHRYNKLVT